MKNLNYLKFDYLDLDLTHHPLELKTDVKLFLKVKLGNTAFADLQEIEMQEKMGENCQEGIGQSYWLKKYDHEICLPIL